MNCRRCGCPSERHDHFRAGTDCGSCGRFVCRSFAGPLATAWQHLKTALLGRAA